MINEVLKEDVFYERPGVAVVTWDPDSLAVFIDWRSWADADEFERLVDAGIRALAEHDASRCLADCRNMKPFNPADQEWIDLNWFPRAYAAGLRRMALVVPYSGMTKMHIEDVLGQVPESQLQVAYFGTVENATEWLTAPW
ncbi:MAG: hypothetical protein PVS3B2_21450 [Candidatus Dormibacteraceae bacterium]